MLGYSQVRENFGFFDERYDGRKALGLGILSQRKLIGIHDIAGDRRGGLLESFLHGFDTRSLHQVL
jgi:hypothetical protein